MMVNMLVNNHAVFTTPLITGDTDEVRVQSEEPYLTPCTSKEMRGVFHF